MSTIWITNAITAGGELTVTQAVKDRTILKATMSWKGEKPVSGSISTTLLGALSSLERALGEDAAKEMMMKGQV